MSEVPVDAQVEAGASEAGVTAPTGCSDYCDFVNVCLAQNEIAAGALGVVITALRADVPAECERACEDQRGTGAPPSPIASCVEAGREAAQCAGQSTQAALRAAIMLLAQCSRANPEDPLKESICEGLTTSPLVANQVDFCD
jgi:hypothetical protein